MLKHFLKSFAHDLNVFFLACVHPSCHLLLIAHSQLFSAFTINSNKGIGWDFILSTAKKIKICNHVSGFQGDIH